MCVELNPDFIRVGERILPEATWVRGDIFQRSVIEGLGRFDEVISNPPYGLRPELTDPNWLTKAPSQYMAAEVAMKVSKHAIFLLNQGDCPFAYSGRQRFEYTKAEAYTKFNEKTGVVFEMNCGLDTSAYENAWKGTKQITEIVIVSKEQREEELAKAA